MIEKVRVSLWDIFTFFMTGCLASIVSAVLLVHADAITLDHLLSLLLKLPASIALVAAPIAFTLLGMLVEPVANYTDRYILKPIFGWATQPKLDSDEAVLMEEILSGNYLGEIGRKLDNPFQLCKDYVEHKQLSSTFMIFLARYGFYRSCAFISLCAGLASLLVSKTVIECIASVTLSILAVVLFRRRAQEFYSYQAPSVYRAFLVEKM